MSIIHVVGLGAGDLKQLPLGSYDVLKESQLIYLRTKEHPVVHQLEQEGLTYESFDEIYEQQDDFEAVYEQIVTTLLDKAKDLEVLVYAVPGHPIVAEKTVQLLLQRGPYHDCQIIVGAGQSFIDPLLSRLRVDPVEGFALLDALAFSVKDIQPECHMILTQVYDAMVASEVKLTLMEIFPDEYEVTIATAVGSAQEVVQTVPLYALDRVTEMNNLTAVYVPPTDEERILNRRYEKSRDIFRTLRGPDGCPWDKKQTHQSLKKYMLEEAQEVVEAIEEDDVDHLIEELGDVLLQVFLHAQIGEDEGLFTMEDVIQSLNDKMIRRHPHVFGDSSVDQVQDVIDQWENIKVQEKQKNGSTEEKK
ncbi:MazG family protein [Caldalkalibacillus salinus]|uniref:MazG family protein n=1 Tax=Caldalkalibacillus salinus TaxID=2803787 RepID=UPI001920A91F|nr:MazG family protein [Caldalkalibacillus salinus]